MRGARIPRESARNDDEQCVMAASARLTHALADKEHNTTTTASSAKNDAIDVRTSCANTHLHTPTVRCAHAAAPYTPSESHQR